jgi:hypothetical protein
MSGADTFDLKTATGCREALASVTAAFMDDGEKADVNKFRAVVQALSTMLEDFARQSRDELETNVEQLKHRLDEWEAAGGNA